MTGQNPIANYTLLNNTTVSDASTYKGQIDANSVAAARIVDQFLAHQAASPNMTVVVDPGNVFSGTTLTEKALQTTGTITAPVSNSRIDRVIVNASTGVIAVVTGTPGVSPTAPAITSGCLPLAQVLLTSATTAITNSMITDERNLWGLANGVVQTGNIASGAITTALIANNAVTNALLAQMNTLTIKSNITGGTANAVDNSLSAIIDAAIGSAQGDVLYRGASGWAALAPGTSGQFLQTQGASSNPIWNTASGVFNQQIFNSSGTWTKPANYDSTAMVLIEAWGAGGGSAASTVGAGGGGRYAYRWLPISTLGSTETVTVGAGGSGGTAGSNGGVSSFGSWITAYGGTGGASSHGGAGGGLASTAAAGTLINDTGYGEGTGATVSIIANSGGMFGGGGGGVGGGGTTESSGGNSIYGGGGGQGSSGGSAGSSQFGGNGGTNGNNGSQPGGGAGEGQHTGGAGRITITVF